MRVAPNGVAEEDDRLISIPRGRDPVRVRPMINAIGTRYRYFGACKKPVG